MYCDHIGSLVVQNGGKVPADLDEQAMPEAVLRAVTTEMGPIRGNPGMGTFTDMSGTMAGIGEENNCFSAP